MKTDPHHNPVKKNFSWWFMNIARGLALVPFWSLRGYVGGSAYFFPRLRVLYGKVFLQDAQRGCLEAFPGNPRLRARRVGADRLSNNALLRLRRWYMENHPDRYPKPGTRAMPGIRNSRVS